MTILLDKSINARIDKDQIDLRNQRLMKSSAAGWQSESILLAPSRSGSPASPGAVDTGDWMGCGVGAPFIFEVNDVYYMYFTDYKYYTDVWLPCIGVATANALTGAYSVSGSDAILEKSGSSWYSHGLFGCSVYDNPNIGGAEQLNLTGDFSVELIVYIESGITTDHHLLSRVDSDNNEQWRLKLDYNGSDLILRAAWNITSGAGWWETLSQAGQTPSLAPAQDELVYIGMSFSSDNDRFSVYLSKNLAGFEGYVDNIASLAGKDVNNTDGGRLYFLNNHAGTAWNSGVHIYAIRIRDAYMATANFTASNPTTMADGLDTGESNVIFGCNFNEANYEFPADEQNYGGLRGVGTGLAWTDDRGMSADANGDKLELLEVPTEAFIMALTGINRTGDVYRLSIGFAYSDALTSGWSIHEPPFQRATALDAAIADSYKTGRNKRLFGVAYPRIFNDAGTLYMLMVVEFEDNAWALVMQELNHVLKAPIVWEVVRRGTQYNSGSVSDFDYLGIVSGAMVEATITVSGNDYDNTLLIGGDTVVSSKHRFNIGTTGRS